MSRISTVVNDALPRYRQNRIKFCGGPMPRMIRDDGSVIDGATYRCADRFCKSCADKRSQRVYACVLARVQQNTLIGVDAAAQSGFMVTLTQKKPRGLTAQDLRIARDRQADIQRETHRLLKRHDYAIARHALHTERGANRRATGWLAVARSTIPLVDLSPCYKEKSSPLINPLTGYRKASGDQTTYIWAREVTAGGSKKYDGWHVHAHYLVPTESDAQRLVAAHIEACSSLGISAAIKNQHISKPNAASYREDADPIADAANYITQYITKSGLDEMPEDVVSAYVNGMSGLRQYDASGRWRPLGIGKKRDKDEPRVISVINIRVLVSSDGELVERALEAPFQEFMKQSGAWWAARDAFILNEYRTKSANENFLDSLKNLAAEMHLNGENLNEYGCFGTIDNPGGDIYSQKTTLNAVTL